MNRTLSTLNQLGLGNAGLLSVHYQPEISSVVEDLITHLLDPSLQESYLNLVSVVEKKYDQDPSHLKTFGSILADVSADSTDRGEFEYIVALQVRVFHIWKRLDENSDPKLTEDAVVDNYYRQAAASIARIKADKWTGRGTKIMAIDISSLVTVIYNALRSGAYFFSDMYKMDVELCRETGDLVLCQPKEEDEWSVFEDLEIL